MSGTHAFEAAVVPCLDTAFNLARWLLREDAAAEDAVQEAVLRALRYFHAVDGEVRPWFLAIVRNACFTSLQTRHGRHETNGLDADGLGALQVAAGLTAPDPVQLLEQGRLRRRIDAAIAALSPPLREVIVLRELEGLSYAEIAQIAALPVGTVMSRLSRARSQLRAALVGAGISE